MEASIGVTSGAGRTTTGGKTAILVIHGMGQQNPYETLDQFGRGMVDHFRITSGVSPTLEPHLISHEGWNEVAMRIDLQARVTAHGSSLIDLYEFYWAPYTEGKVTYLQTLNWIRRTVLTPLRYLGYGYHLFSRPGRQDQLCGAFVREMARSIFLFLPAAVLTFLLVYLFKMSDRALPKAQSLLKIFTQAPPWNRLWLVLFVAFLALVVTNLQALWVLWKEWRITRAKGLRGVDKEALRLWTLYSLAAFLCCALATAILALLSRETLLSLWREVNRPHLLIPLIFAPGSLLLKKLLVGYVGDIAVYVNTDEKAASFQARSAILKEAREAILRLLRSSEQYERIVLAGHSLGSVIAYDLLNRLLDEVRAPYGTGPQGPLPHKLSANELMKVRGLVTFGSPLDKVYYFFRTEVPTQQAIRGQILSFMHGFRRAPSGRAYGSYMFCSYDVPDPSPDFTWFNVWAGADPGSGHLDFYQVAGHEDPDPVSNQFDMHFPYWRWGYAHVMYWSDPRFYFLVAEGLL